MQTPRSPQLHSQIRTHEVPSQAQDTTQVTTCKKVLRIVGLILLTIFTLGLFLLWKYCCSSRSIEPQSEPAITDSQPQSTTPAPVRYAVATTTVQRQQHSQNSPEFLFALQQQHLYPEACNFFTITGELNSGFLCTYPLSVYQTFEHEFLSLQEKLISSEDPSSAYEAMIAEQRLSQLQYLEQNYYLVQVPGDNSCFYRSYIVGWLCALMKEKTQGNLDVFKQEIERLQNLECGKSFSDGLRLTQQAIQILDICDQCPNLLSLYNHVILNPRHITTLITYFKEISFHVADARKLQLFGEADYRQYVLTQINLVPELFERAFFSCIRNHCQQNLLQEISSKTTTKPRRSTDWWLFLELFLHFSVFDHNAHFPIFDTLYQQLFQWGSSLKISEEQTEALRQIISECTENPDPLFVSHIQQFKHKLDSYHKISISPSILSAALTLLVFFFQTPQPFPFTEKYKELSSRLYATLVPILQENIRSSSAFPAGELSTLCYRLLSLNLPVLHQPEDTLLEKLFQLWLQDPFTQMAMPLLKGEPYAALLYSFDPQKIQETIQHVMTELPDEWQAHTKLFSRLQAYAPVLANNDTNRLNQQILISFLLSHHSLLITLSEENRLSIPCQQNIQSLLKAINTHCTQSVQQLPIYAKKQLLEQYQHTYSAINKLKICLAKVSRDYDSTLIKTLSNFVLQAPIKEVTQFSRSTYYQAEDEHVTCIAAVFGSLSLCQSLLDNELQQNVPQLLHLSTTHGFLTFDFAPEELGRIFVLRQNNHFSALLPKTKLSNVNNN